MLFIKSLIGLLVIDLYLLRGNFSSLYRKVRSCSVATKPSTAEATERVCAAFDLACAWYPKRALCLQRSSALTCLLRRQGIAAQLIIGAQRLPFRAHAWVELNGEVVNDKPYMREIYAILETC
jgi:hypothetical protein